MATVLRVTESSVRVADPLTGETAGHVCAEIAECLADFPATLTLNLEDVRAVDVVGLAALLQAVRRAEARGCRVLVQPSAAVHRALLNSGLLDDVPLDLPALSVPALMGTTGERADAPPFVATARRIGLRQPRWEDLGLFERWAADATLDEMVGSHLLYLCRHLGPYHPDAVAHVMYDPMALTLLIQPRDSEAAPVGFVRLYGINLAERFAFLETAVADHRSARAGWGVEASRLLLAYAMDALELTRIEAKVYGYNVLSANALRRNGFREEGVLRQTRHWDGRRWDILVFGILEDELRAQRARESYPYMGFWPPRLDARA
jgi:RimJ/RimL family protein N-acetyltransferase/ABC-type transporter Mla MlaB component